MNPTEPVRISPEAMQAQAEAAAALLKAMANPQRLKVLCLLLGGEQSVGDLNRDVDLSQSALSQHLAVLRESALVTTRRSGQTIYYALSTGPVEAIIATLHAHYCAPPAHAPLCRPESGSA
ncbi:MAG: metalloregulator ArsR/SmtB family transcription factor [Xanthomonadales bacterium]|nr:metalloregulator ArsR/SmtB family transcription factor [Xanthomonadales bacterium]